MDFDTSESELEAEPEQPDSAGHQPHELAENCHMGWTQQV